MYNNNYTYTKYDDQKLNQNQKPRNSQNQPSRNNWQKEKDTKYNANSIDYTEKETPILETKQHRVTSITSYHPELLNTKAKINGQCVNVFFDSGATISVISEEM